MNKINFVYIDKNKEKTIDKFHNWLCEELVQTENIDYERAEKIVFNTLSDIALEYLNDETSTINSREQHVEKENNYRKI